jgi:hypothetical protein
VVRNLQARSVFQPTALRFRLYTPWGPQAAVDYLDWCTEVPDSGPCSDTGYPEVYCDFIQPLQRYLKFGHIRFVPRPFPFTVL